MALATIYTKSHSAYAPLPAPDFRKTHVTVVNGQGPGPVFAETSLASVRGAGGVHAWISSTRRQPAGVGVVVATFPADLPYSSARWVPDCVSVTFTLHVYDRESAYATVKLTTWGQW